MISQISLLTTLI